MVIQFLPRLFASRLRRWRVLRRAARQRVRRRALLQVRRPKQPAFARLVRLVWRRHAPERKCSDKLGCIACVAAPTFTWVWAEDVAKM